MSSQFLESLNQLEEMFWGAGVPGYLDDLYVDLLFVVDSNENLDECDWQDVSSEVAGLLDEDDPKCKYGGLVVVDSLRSCLAYRVTDSSYHAIDRYKKAASHGANLLRKYHILLDDKIDCREYHLWSVGIHELLSNHRIASSSLRHEPLGTFDLSLGEGPRLVKVHRQMLPSTAIRSSLHTIKCLRDIIGVPLKVNDLEWEVCRLLSDGRTLIEEKIDPKLPFPNENSNLKNTLSALVKRGFLENTRGHGGGYSLTTYGRIALAAAPKV